MTKTVTINIDALANVVVEADGFTGTECVDTTRPLELALAGEGGIEVREFKPEYGAQAGNKQVRATTRMG